MNGQETFVEVLVIVTFGLVLVCVLWAIADGWPEDEA